jgi:hypothetical protein
MIAPDQHIISASIDYCVEPHATGWSVGLEQQTLIVLRDQRAAVAHAIILARRATHLGRSAQVLVRTPSGHLRTELVFSMPSRARPRLVLVKSPIPRATESSLS